MSPHRFSCRIGKVAGAIYVYAFSMNLLLTAPAAAHNGHTNTISRPSLDQQCLSPTSGAGCGSRTRVPPSHVIPAANNDCPVLVPGDNSPHTGRSVGWQEGSPDYCPCWRDIDQLVQQQLEVTRDVIIPATIEDILKGSKFFGAAVFDQQPPYDVIVSSVNHEKMNPLNHAEVDAIRDFYTLPTECRPPTNETIFYATHAPCSYCLSALVWNDFRELYTLVDYAATTSMGIGMDQEMILELFHISSADLDTKFLKGWYVRDLINNCASAARVEELEALFQAVLRLYLDPSDPSSVVSLFSQHGPRTYTPVGRRLHETPQNVAVAQVIPAEGDFYSQPYCAHWLGAAESPAGEPCCTGEHLGQFDVRGVPGASADRFAGDQCKHSAHHHHHHHEQL